MVKNTQGGSKHKGMARKLVNAPISAKPRLSECDDECYAVVTKMLGNGMCHVDLSYQTNIVRDTVCHIRGKFRGRNKKNNLVQTNNFILVGLRTWENPIKNCDLIFTFIDSHIHSIPFDFNYLISTDHINSDIHHQSFNISQHATLIDHNDNHNHNDTKLETDIIIELI